MRHGFVSNSSSSSFCIFGTQIDSNDKNISDIDKLYSTDLEHYQIYDDGYIYIGLSWDKIKDDETGLQFKERVNEAINTLLGKKVECSTLERAWSDY
jgi:hypothetical protein